MTERVYNFSAGPAVMPEAVLRQAQQDLWTYSDTGIGIAEHSHRGAAFTEVIQSAEASIRGLLGVSDKYDVLFLQGGASTQFFMIPMNLLKGKNADYISTGSWSEKAIKEAKLFGDVNVIASSKEEGFNHIPSDYRVTDGATYLHFTSNNTIVGTQFGSEPETPNGAWLACDASSDILSRPIDIDRYGVLYAGAQKNLGPSGVTLVVIRKDLVESGADDLPTMLQYRTHAAKGSAFNTPPTLAIYIVGEVAKWLTKFGGLKAISEYNQVKAKMLYEHIDNSKVFYGTAKEDSRSTMNVCFRCHEESLEPVFLKEAAAKGLMNLKGHRSIGGMRASIYNAMPKEGCEALLAFMKEFESSHG